VFGSLLNSFQKLKRVFTNDLVIDASSQVFVFSIEDNSISLGTFIYLDEREGKRRVVGVGDESTVIVASRRYEIFSCDLWRSDESFAAELLEAFTRYGIQKICNIDGFKLVRPVVTIKGCGSLGETYRRRATDVLTTSAKAAGATSVKVVD